MQIDWKIGVEMELLAPPGRSRRDLAERLAAQAGGRIRPYFLPQSEPSQVDGVAVFHNLTLAYAVEDADGELVACCVDDLTLQADLDRHQPPEPGWFRVISDDMRLLRLVQRHGRADSGARAAVEGVAALFGTEVQQGEGGMLRVFDESGASVAIAAPLPGERHRPCELITPPMVADHAARLQALLEPARELGFTLPQEAASHIHFDGVTLQSAFLLRNLVRFLSTEGEILKRMVGTNPRCVRLGAWPETLIDTVEATDFLSLPWSVARERLLKAKLSKYCDYNLVNLVLDLPGKSTFEVRVLPGMQEPTEVIAAAALFEAVLRRARRLVPRQPSHPWSRASALKLLSELPLSQEAREHWLLRVKRL